MGIIVLEGGAEFGGGMVEVDRQAIDAAGGLDAPIRIIPTAAAPDNNYRRAGQNGINWFQSLGATDVSALELIDSPSADDAAIAAQLAGAGLIYLLGGFPQFLGTTLKGSKSWQAVLEAYAGGAVIAGSSAGARVPCEYYYDPTTSRLHRGLGLLSGICVLPHHDTFGSNWVPSIGKMGVRVVMVGIDEQTGIIDTSTPNRWRVLGKGGVTIYRDDGPIRFSSQQEFRLAAGR